MVGKTQKTAKATTTGRVKLGKLQLGKETIKDLTTGKRKHIKGGAINDVPETNCRTCSCRAPC
jgi:hypothetical protein